MKTIRARFLIPGSKRGVALILTLIAIVLLAVLILAFFSKAQLNQKISYSSTNLLKADALARSASDLVVGELREEIRNNSTTTATVSGGITYTSYTPNAPINMVPLRANSGEPNLIRNSMTAPPSASAAASTAISSAIASLNNRSVSTTTWDAIRLRNAAVTTATAPQWVLLTRSGVKSNIGLADAANKTSPNYVIGRYAYAIYDEGGLLNINVAGAPSTVTSGTTEKVFTAMADPTQVGLTPAQVSALTAWRNATTMTDYTGYISGTGPTYGVSGSASANSAPVTGFTSVVAGDNTFLNRQDLLTYASANGIDPANPSPGANNTMYLATSSYEENGPSALSGNNALALTGTDTVNNPNFNTIISPITHKPLQRFLLSRFSLLDQDPTKLSTQEAQAIRTYFGLVPDAKTSNTHRVWDYSPISNPVVSPATIATLAEVMAQNTREPNVFELVHAAMVNGSLGVNLSDSSDDQQQIFCDFPIQSLGSVGYTPETSITTQVGRIIANMIDQYDSDNYPTTIIMNSSQGNTVYGIEHLPYFSEINLKAYLPSGLTGAFAAGASGTFQMTFELWDPHRGTAPSNGPANIRIAFDHAQTYFWRYSDADDSTLPNLEYTYQSSPKTYSATSVDGSSGTNGGILIGPLANYINHPLNVPTVYTFAPPDIDPVAAWTDEGRTGKPGWTHLYFSTQKLTIALQYQDANGNWDTYTTLAGNDDDQGKTGLNMGDVIYPPEGNRDLDFTTSISATSPPNDSIPKPDPRTFRFRMGTCHQNYSPNMAMCMSGSDQNATNHYPAFFPNAPGGSASGGFCFPGEIYKNSVPGANGIMAKDADDVARRGDGYLDNSSKVANPMLTWGARPIILNRPFHSVGELGYVFRDSPWKSLNFFSGTDSGDAALLDIFTLGQSEVIAGNSSLNTAQPKVLQALLNGAVQDEAGDASPAVPPLSVANATQIATDITAQTKIATNPTSPAPFINVGGVATQLASAASSQADSNYSAVKTAREAIARALSTGTQTRTWNLLIDLIAQTGKYPLNPAGLDKFVVEGEKHYWVHVAIDRFTGKIVKTQMESVND